MIVAEVERTRTQSGWSADRTLAALGIARATYYRRRGELGREGTEARRDGRGTSSGDRVQASASGATAPGARLDGGR